MSEQRSWTRMPRAAGPHWFVEKLKDRLKTPTKPWQLLYNVARIEFVVVKKQDGKPTFHHTNCIPSLIEPDEGWWLPIVDERATAPVDKKRTHVPRPIGEGHPRAKLTVN